MLHKKGSGGASETWWLIGMPARTAFWICSLYRVLGAFVAFNHIVGLYTMFFYTVPKSVYIAMGIVSFFTAFGGVSMCPRRSNSRHFSYRHHWWLSPPLEPPRL